MICKSKKNKAAYLAAFEYSSNKSLIALSSSFESFYEWSMKNGYSCDLSIDRVNVDGNYEPSNCRWSDRITQNNNKRNNRIIEFGGKSHTVSEWARALEVNASSMNNCLNKRGESETIQKYFKGA